MQLALVNTLAGEIPAIPAAETIVARMDQVRTENRSRLRPYDVVRSYQLSGHNQLQTKAEVIADISYIPPDVEHYRIRKASGQGLSEIVVRKVLESEIAVLLKQSESEISPANYAFRLLREDFRNGHRCYVLELRALRKDPNLIQGTIWVNAVTFVIERMEGRPAKPPSWWVHNIYVAVDFRDIDGMWLQTALYSTAEVRLLGQHTLVSRIVEYKMGEVDAAVTPAAAIIMDVK
jgi:hypothetical protein